jgi:hypothetical protein
MAYYYDGMVAIVARSFSVSDNNDGNITFELDFGHRNVILDLSLLEAFRLNKILQEILNDQLTEINEERNGQN